MPQHIDGELTPLTLAAAQLEDNFNAFLDGVAESVPPEIKDILVEARQSTLGRALIADLVDVVPILGDVSNFFRVRHAGQIGVERDRRLTRQTIDLALGVLPDPVGGILDLLTPTNTVTYLREEGLLQ